MSNEVPEDFDKLQQETLDKIKTLLDGNREESFFETIFKDMKTVPDKDNLLFLMLQGYLFSVLPKEIEQFLENGGASYKVLTEGIASSDVTKTCIDGARNLYTTCEDVQCTDINKNFAVPTTVHSTPRSFEGFLSNIRQSVFAEEEDAFYTLLKKVGYINGSRVFDKFDLSVIAMIEDIFGKGAHVKVLIGRMLVSDLVNYVSESIDPETTRERVLHGYIGDVKDTNIEIITTSGLAVSEFLSGEEFIAVDCTKPFGFKNTIRPIAVSMHHLPDIPSIVNVQKSYNMYITDCSRVVHFTKMSKKG